MKLTIADSIAAYIEVAALVAFIWQVAGPEAVNSSD
jgi:hypothetical protein